MTTPRLDFSPLLHIEAAAQECLAFTANLDFVDFLGDRKTRAAVAWQLCIIGEAANRVDESTRRQAPEIDWRKMVGMRNILIHQYDRIDYALVWNAVNNELPPLIASIRRLPNDLDAAPY